MARVTHLKPLCRQPVVSDRPSGRPGTRDRRDGRSIAVMVLIIIWRPRSHRAKSVHRARRRCATIETMRRSRRHSSSAPSAGHRGRSPEIAISARRAPNGPQTPAPVRAIRPGVKRCREAERRRSADPTASYLQWCMNIGDRGKIPGASTE